MKASKNTAPDDHLYLVALAGQGLSLVLHCFFLWVFHAHGADILYYFNYFSILLFITIIHITLKRKEFIPAARIALIAEVLIHQSIAIILLGYSYGFQYLFIAASTFFVLIYYRVITIALALVALSFCCLAGTYWLHFIIEPIYSMPEATRLFMYALNVGSTFFITSSIALIFSLSVHRYEKLLLRESHTDSLTQLANRTRMMSFLRGEFDKSGRAEEEIVVAIGDIDDFKRINDTYGHLAGDLALVETSNTMQSHLRKRDMVGRWGGEEFLLVLPGTDMDGGLQALEKVRRAVSDLEIEWDKQRLQLTMTFGAACTNDFDNIEDLLKMADMALYDGKKAGKNRVARAVPRRGRLG